MKTIRRSLQALTLAVAMLAAFARDAQPQGWWAGAKAGFGQGGFTGSEEFQWTSGNPAASLFFARPFGSHFWVQPELNFMRKKGVSILAGSSLTVAADYLDFPLILQYRTRSLVGLSPFLAVGPSVSVRLRCNIAFEGGGISTSDDCDVIRGQVTSSIDFGANGGGGLAWTIGASTFALEGRLSVGFNSASVPIDAATPRSYNWSVVLGASVPLRFSQRGSPLPGAPVVGRGVPSRVPSSLPPIASTTIVDPEAAIGVPDTALRAGSARRVTVRAVDADTRALLIAVAQQAGISVVVSDDVRGRVSVSLVDVPGPEAIRAITEAAGLSIAAPQTPLVAAVVFYQLPVNVNNAPANVIANRFGTSTELANFIVESRPDKRQAP
jgi:hypothetical protein